jgi:hypothetical protein
VVGKRRKSLKRLDLVQPKPGGPRHDQAVTVALALLIAAEPSGTRWRNTERVGMVKRLRSGLCSVCRRNHDYDDDDENFPYEWSESEEAVPYYRARHTGPAQTTRRRVR